MRSKLIKQGLYFNTLNRRDKLIEELSELIRAVAMRDRDNMVEEIADVHILLVQYMDRFNITYDEIVKMIEYKFNRTEERIKDGEI